MTVMVAVVSLTVLLMKPRIKPCGKQSQLAVKLWLARVIPEADRARTETIRRHIRQTQTDGFPPDPLVETQRFARTTIMRLMMMTT